MNKHILLPTKDLALPERKIVRGIQTNDVAYLQRMPAGIPGMVNRNWADLAVFPEVQDADLPATVYGNAVKIGTNNLGVSPLTTGDTAGDIYGVLVLPFPLQGYSVTGYGSVQLGPQSAVPPTQGPVDVLKTGAITVSLKGDAPAVKGAPAYIWVAASTGTHVIGGWEAAADGGNTIAAPAIFRGPADSSGNVEIIFQKLAL